MKELFDRCVIHNIYFSILAFISIALIIASFIVPPTGVIDPSVLAATGEIFAFAALGAVYKAMDKDKSISLSHGQTTITLNGKTYRLEDKNNEEKIDGNYK